MQLLYKIVKVITLIMFLYSLAFFFKAATRAVLLFKAMNQNSYEISYLDKEQGSLLQEATTSSSNIEK